MNGLLILLFILVAPVSSTGQAVGRLLFLAFTPRRLPDPVCPPLLFLSPLVANAPDPDTPAVILLYISRSDGAALAPASPKLAILMDRVLSIFAKLIDIKYDLLANFFRVLKKSYNIVILGKIIHSLNKRYNNGTI